jgi:replicative DNA helicase
MSIAHLGIHDDQSDRTPPHDLLAEQSVLGGMMLSKRAAGDVLDEGITAIDFYQPRHGLIFDAIHALIQDAQPCDVIAVTNQLTERGELRRAGGAEYLHQLTGVTPTSANAGYYATIVTRKAVLRRLVEAGTRIVQMGYASEGDAYELAENARLEVDSTIGARPSELLSVGDTIDAVADSLADQPRFTPTPWSSLNDLINGFRPGALYVVGARPGDGKTIVGLQAAAHLAKYGPVAYCSLEMDTPDLTKRLLAMKGDIHMSALTRNALSPRDWTIVDHQREQLRDLPLFIDDRSAVTMTQIRSFARNVARRGKLQGIVVDYLQLIASHGSQKARWEIVGEYTRALKILAREFDVPVIILSQLNRGNADGNREPTLSDLRESGSIEQDADVVMLLQRGWNEQAEAKSDELTIHVAKNRHGNVGKFDLLWEGHFARVSVWE